MCPLKGSTSPDHGSFPIQLVKRVRVLRTRCFRFLITKSIAFHECHRFTATREFIISYFVFILSLSSVFYGRSTTVLGQNLQFIYLEMWGTILLHG
jgi:hypothetical protein